MDRNQTTAIRALAKSIRAAKAAGLVLMLNEKSIVAVDLLDLMQVEKAQEIRVPLATLVDDVDQYVVGEVI